MIWNNIPNNERIHLWKNLRNTIKNLPIDEKLHTVAKFFAPMPFGARTIDFYSAKDWPTPWEIIFYGSLCRSSISLLIFYTLSMLETGIAVQLVLIDDSIEEYLLPIINNQFVLNYEIGVVSSYTNIKSEFTEKLIFSEEQIKKIL